MNKRVLALIVILSLWTQVSAQFLTNGATTSGSIEFRGTDFTHVIQNPDSSILAYNNANRGHFIAKFSETLKQVNGKFIHLQYGGETQRLKDIIWFNNTCYVFVTFYNIKHRKKYLFYSTLNHNTLELSKDLIKVAELSVYQENDYIKVKLNKSKNRLLILGLVRSRTINIGTPSTYTLTSSYWVLNEEMRVIQTQTESNLDIKNFSNRFSLVNIEYKDDDTFYLFCKNYHSLLKTEALTEFKKNYWTKFNHSTYAVIKFKHGKTPMIYETNAQDTILDAKMRISADKVHIIGILNDINEPHNFNGQSLIHIELDKNYMVTILDTVYGIINGHYTNVSGLDVSGTNNVVYTLEKRNLTKTTTPGNSNPAYGEEKTKTIVETEYEYGDIYIGVIKPKYKYHKKYSRSSMSEAVWKNQTAIFITRQGYVIGLPDVILNFDSKLNLLDMTVVQTRFNKGDNLRTKVQCFLHKKVSPNSFIIAAKVGVMRKLQIHKVDEVLIEK
jgi:hypothetical protein